MDDNSICLPKKIGAILGSIHAELWGKSEDTCEDTLGSLTRLVGVVLGVINRGDVSAGARGGCANKAFVTCGVSGCKIRDKEDGRKLSKIEELVSKRLVVLRPVCDKDSEDVDFRSFLRFRGKRS